MGIAKLTATFLLPLICKNRTEYRLLFTPNLKGVYYKDINKPNWGIKIILDYERIPPLQVMEFYNKSEYAYDKYVENVDGTIHNVFSFIIPPKYKKDADHIINGEYEKLHAPIGIKICNIFKSIPGVNEFLEKILFSPNLLPRNTKGIVRYPFKNSKNEVLNISNVKLKDEDLEAIKQAICEDSLFL